MANKINYSKEPTLCNKVVYEDDNHKLTKIWTWNVACVYGCNKASICRVLLNGDCFNTAGGKSTFVSYDGKRLTDLEFDYMDDDYEMILVGINKKGYGYVNEKGEMVVSAKYCSAGDFCNGYAPVYDGNEWLYVDNKGEELRLENKYERIECFSDELARVSSLNINRLFSLAYYSEYSDNAGTWGYVDKTGKEVIKPQYIYAFDFINDRAIVAKGKWTIDKKWDNEYKQGKYWTEEELWGVIDKNGNEIIPCVYDEIRCFINNDNDQTICEDYYQVHVGGWQEGKWAIIDRNGNFVTEPIFEDYSYDYYKGMFVFGEKDKYGIYDLKTNKILFESQFDDVSFLEDDNIFVEVIDKDLGYKIEKIIDITGKELFKSNYTDIYTWAPPYIAIKENKKSTIYNKIDKKGNILDSIEFEEKVSYWDNAINFETRTYIYSQNGKFGLKSFSGEIIIQAQYEYFKECYNNKNFFYFEKKKDNNNVGLMRIDGEIIIPPQYRNISVLKNNKIICNGRKRVDVYEYENR